MDKKLLQTCDAKTGATGPARGLLLPGALAGLLRHPLETLGLWNWKAACLSILLRGPIFLAASFRRGLGAALSALLIESVFCMASAGFYGAIVQTVRDAQPEWLTVTFVAVVMPAVFQAMEFIIHYLHGTPHLRGAELTSIFASGLSSLFTWYAMRRGTLLVGAEGRGFLYDLRQLPILLFGFVAAAPAWVRQRLRDAPGPANGFQPGRRSS